MTGDRPTSFDSVGVSVVKVEPHFSVDIVPKLKF